MYQKVGKHLGQVTSLLQTHRQSFTFILESAFKEHGGRKLDTCGGKKSPSSLVDINVTEATVLPIPTQQTNMFIVEYLGTNQVFNKR